MSETKDRYADVDTAVANRKTARERVVQAGSKVRSCQNMLDQAKEELARAEAGLESANRQVDAAAKELK